uniref:Uncharacterized protein n=2 Tax=Knipowitschia caucasica TaxID=637954 RepID=A0AAV2KK51_KNICA
MSRRPPTDRAVTPEHDVCRHSDTLLPPLDRGGHGGVMGGSWGGGLKNLGPVMTLWKPQLLLCLTELWMKGSESLRSATARSLSGSGGGSGGVRRGSWGGQGRCWGRPGAKALSSDCHMVHSHRAHTSAGHQGDSAGSLGVVL